MAETSLFPLDEGSTPEEELEAAAASARAAVEGPVGAEGEPEPFGMTWLFDFAKERFIRRGGAPLEVYDQASLPIWAQAALRTARSAYPVFTDGFGREDPESLVGQLEPGELMADYESRIREALTVHDRIAAVTDFKFTFVGDVVEITFTIEPDSGSSQQLSIEVPA